MGNNPHGTDIYVPSEHVERARDLLTSEGDDYDNDSDGAVTEDVE